MKDDKEVGCGISWLWMTKDEKFHNACAWHDEQYVLKTLNKQGSTRKTVDKMFLLKMLESAGENKVLKARAYLYYGIVKIFGGLFW